jgi:very-short-patch-repair endonuclease
MREESANQAPDRVIARIAARQHGIASLSQLLAAGISVDGVLRRVRAGRLHRLHRGVYAVGHVAPNRHRVWLAGVLACGPEAVLSHQSAAALWLLLPAQSGPVHVTVIGDGGRQRRAGILVHRSATLSSSTTTRRDGIPVTKPARTIIDLRRTVPRDQVERAIDRARALGLPIGDEGAGEPTRSHLERRFLALCRRHRLPRPEANARVGPFLVDFLWREHRLIVETDGYVHHRGRAAFEADRARDTELKLRGYEVVRLTYRQVVEEPGRVAATVRTLLTGDAQRI